MFVVAQAASLLKVKSLMNCVRWQFVPLTAGNIISDIAHKDGSLKASKRGVLKTGLQSGLESAFKIIEQISNSPRTTTTDLANLLVIQEGGLPRQ